jgi:hypothetical protein
MTFDVDLDESINESFHAVLILTGSLEVAERAVTDAIGQVDLNDSGHALVVQSVRWAFCHTQGSSKLCRTLPPELQALSFLSPIPRYCFVLRFLVGLDGRNCSDVLKLSDRDVDEALYQALLKTPSALRSIRCSSANPAP